MMNRALGSAGGVVGGGDPGPRLREGEALERLEQEPRRRRIEIGEPEVVENQESIHRGPVAGDLESIESMFDGSDIGRTIDDGVGESIAPTRQRGPIQ
jgi:hypothetical protein